MDSDKLRLLECIHILSRQYCKAQPHAHGFQNQSNLIRESLSFEVIAVLKFRRADLRRGCLLKANNLIGQSSQVWRNKIRIGYARGRQGGIVGARDKRSMAACRLGTYGIPQMAGNKAQV